jgi:hypothetical protein
MKLFWCTTDDHDEDWFVVAPSEDAAREHFEDAEGYGVGDARAEWVVDVPEGLDLRLEDGAKARWADDELLLACGGERLPYVPDGDDEAIALRSVMGVVSGAWKFGGGTYVSGDITLGRDGGTGRN